MRSRRSRAEGCTKDGSEHTQGTAELMSAASSALSTVGRTGVLFVATALAEIVGCYLPYLWLRKGGAPWLLLPATISLAVFAWLLTLHPTGAARTYAAYGGVYIATALFWLWIVEGERPTRWDMVGAGVAVIGMMIIVLGPRGD